MKRRILCLLAVLVLLAALCVPAAAEDSENYVYDLAGILNEDDVSVLNDLARDISLQHNCGIYVAVFPDMAEYGYHSIEDFAEAVYKQWDLGLGSERTGIALVMSMDDRDYDLCAYGNDAHYAFTDYGKDVVADEFKDDFRSNDWAEGFYDYIRACEYMLTKAEEGDPVDVSYSRGPAPSLTEKLGKSAPIGIIAGIIIAFVYCSMLKKSMKTAKIAREAAQYVAPQGVRMQDEQDMFTHTTVTRQHIERERSGGGGGTSVNSGGFSHSSGKF